jgi:hypothetical protein
MAPLKQCSLLAGMLAEALLAWLAPWVSQAQVKVQFELAEVHLVESESVVLELRGLVVTIVGQGVMAAIVSMVSASFLQLVHQ